VESLQSTGPASGALDVLLPAGGITLRDAHGHRLTIEGAAGGITVRTSGALSAPWPRPVLIG